MIVSLANKAIKCKEPWQKGLCVALALLIYSVIVEKNKHYSTDDEGHFKLSHGLKTLWTGMIVCV